MKLDVYLHHDAAVIGRLETILTMQENTMAGLAELDAKLSELANGIATEMQQLADAVAAAAPDLSPQVARIQGMIDALKSDDPAAPAPAPAPTDTPPTT